MSDFRIVQYTNHYEVQEIEFRHTGWYPPIQNSYKTLFSCFTLKEAKKFKLDKELINGRIIE